MGKEVFGAKGSLRHVGMVTLSAAAFLLVAACDDSPTDPPPVDPAVYEWEGTLEGTEDFAEVSGDIGMSFTDGASSFKAEVAVEGAEPESVLSWAVIGGTCAEPTDIVGDDDAYTPLEVDGEGEASASVTVSTSITVTGSYHISVWLDGDEDEEEENVIVACGNLSAAE